MAIVEYTKNETALVQMDLGETIQYIVQLVEDNKYMLEEVYSMQSVRSGRTK